MILPLELQTPGWRLCSVQHESEAPSPAEEAPWKRRLIVQGAQGSDWAAGENRKRWAMWSSWSCQVFNRADRWKVMESDTNGTRVIYVRHLKK
jgi:hypothetical protein